MPRPPPLQLMQERSVLRSVQLPLLQLLGCCVWLLLCGCCGCCCDCCRCAWLLLEHNCELLLLLRLLCGCCCCVWLRPLPPPPPAPPS